MLAVVDVDSQLDDSVTTVSSSEDGDSFRRLALTMVNDAET